MNKGIIRRILKYTVPYKPQLAGSLIGALVSAPLTLLAPILIGKAVDHIIGAGQVEFLAIGRILLWLLLTVMASSVFQWLLLACTRSVSALAAQDMRQQAFERINQVPLKLIDTHSHGDLVSRLVNDADAVAEGLLQGLTQLLPGVVTILATLGLMLWIDPFTTLVVVLVTPLSILFARFVTGRTSGMFREQSTVQGKISGFVGEMVTNQSLVRAFGGEAAFTEEFAGFNQEYYDANFKATFYSSAINPGTRFVNAVVYAAVAVFGSLSALSGSITVGDLSAFLAFANQYTKPFNEVTSVLTQIQSAVASARRLFEVIDWQPEAADLPDALEPQKCEGAVAVKNVFFSYNPERPLIRNFVLDAKPGTRIALVGPTGCGKTTLINLLMRFYEVDSGEISIDGTPILAMKRDAMRGLYGMVLQETWLKQATVKENIAFGCSGATYEEVKEAARAAYAHGFIKRMPNGYDTVIGAGGGSLSAGQRQLLCIARIMLTKPDMLILDEATSSIDTRTEMLIQKALEKLMSGHTSFIVAHRLSTIQNADLILVMKDGEIIERGRHEELLERGGFYHNLYHSQFAIE